ncbi:MAG: hypothetical protein ACO3CS_05245, partial [Alphaproteobacteria bacterium]
MPTAFPPDFADMLAPGAARRIARHAGALASAPAGEAGFLSLASCLAPESCARGLAALEATMLPLLSRIDVPIPAATIWNQTRSFQERLPKVARLRTAYLERRGTRAWRAAEGLGVLGLLRSPGLRARGAARGGRPLQP